MALNGFTVAINIILDNPMEQTISKIFASTELLSIDRNSKIFVALNKLLLKEKPNSKSKNIYANIITSNKNISNNNTLINSEKYKTFALIIIIMIRI
ncbi:MAG: hypothetical protein GXP61_11425 [Epsilonproteobacteria bacterium]|nr:hypothetical protein [Campylobacterota bacterium]